MLVSPQLYTDKIAQRAYSKTRKFDEENFRSICVPTDGDIDEIRLRRLGGNQDLIENGYTIIIDNDEKFSELNKAFIDTILDIIVGYQYSRRDYHYDYLSTLYRLSNARAAIEEFYHVFDKHVIIKYEFNESLACLEKFSVYTKGTELIKGDDFPVHYYFYDLYFYEKYLQEYFIRDYMKRQQLP